MQNQELLSNGTQRNTLSYYHNNEMKIIHSRNGNRIHNRHVYYQKHDLDI